MTNFREDIDSYNVRVALTLYILTSVCIFSILFSVYTSLSAEKENLSNKLLLDIIPSGKIIPHGISLVSLMSFVFDNFWHKKAQQRFFKPIF